MANEVKLPRLGQGMEAGTITKWLKSPGDKVEKGEPLFEIDTDKVTQEVESDFAGVLLKITLESGEAPVGQTIAYIGKEGEEVAAVLQYQAFDWLDAPIERVGAKFAPLAFAPVMEQFIIPHAEDVLAAIKRTVGK